MAINLGIPIKIGWTEYCPFYDDKNQMLYFTSRRINIEPRVFNNLLGVKRYSYENNNGLSKIYRA